MTEKLAITVDISKMVLSDLEILDNAQVPGKANMKQMLDLLDRVVVGGARSLPLNALPQILEAINKAITEASNPTPVPPT